MKWTERSVTALDLSARSCHALMRAGICTAGALAECDEGTLRRIRNLGEKSVCEILEVIATMDRSDTQAEETDATIDDLHELSPAAYNALRLNGLQRLEDVAALDEAMLRRLPLINAETAAEICVCCRGYLRRRDQPLHERLLSSAKNVEILSYVRENDVSLEAMLLPNPSKNKLARANLNAMSDLIMMSETALRALPAMGDKSFEPIRAAVEAYITRHSDALEAILNGEEIVPFVSEEQVRETVLALYGNREFYGFSLAEFREAAGIRDKVDEPTLKTVIGGLIAAGELEYTDYRCYRVYEPFETAMARCTVLKGTERRYLEGRLQGLTFQEIGEADGDKSREYVSDVIVTARKKLRQWYRNETGKAVFDEEFYRTLYETYAVDIQDAEQWLGIPTRVFRVLTTLGYKRGKAPLDKAAGDRDRLGLGLRLKIKNYINRDKLFLDGEWIAKKRKELERVVVRRFFTETTSFDTYFSRFNDCLRALGVEEESLLYTDGVRATRRNLIAGARFVLWSYGEHMRYYDIDGRRYEELYEGLGLDVLQNIEISTAKLFREHPDLMEEYDIRDHYELHNLLRKTLPEGSFHAFECRPSPYICFGEFDRTAALFDMLIDHAPISSADLLAKMQEEYGYDPGVGASYLDTLAEYYHQGFYRVDQKDLPAGHAALLKSRLTEAFYWIDEIRKCYRELVPDGDPEAVNPYTLKQMGFTVMSRYILQGFDTTEAFFEALLTRDELYDIRPYHQRFRDLQTYYQKLLELKRQYRVVEFEPHQMVTAARLHRNGLTEEKLRAYVDAVAEAVEEDTYFTVASLRADGLTFDIEDYGFSDWFYASLVAADPRFSSGKWDGLRILYKGEATVSRQSFLAAVINGHGSVDMYDLYDELSDRYGCRLEGRGDVTWLAVAGGAYYDGDLDRMYGSEALYRLELEETEALM